MCKGPGAARIRLLLGFCYAAMLCLAACSFAPRFALCASVAPGLAVSVIWPTLLGDQFPRGGASMFGLMTGAGNAGGIFMPWLIGRTADAAGSPAFGIAAAAFYPLLLLLLLAWLRRHARPTES